MRAGSPEVDKVIADLHQAGLLTVGRDAEGHARWALTPSGRQLAKLAATLGPEDPAGRVSLVLGAMVGRHGEALGS